jgi:hypothetical protein
VEKKIQALLALLHAMGAEITDYPDHAIVRYPVGLRSDALAFCQRTVFEFKQVVRVTFTPNGPSGGEISW